MRSVDGDGRRLTAGPKELQEWRERFARELRRHGVEAEATPRQARGQVRKSDKIAVHKIEERGQVADTRTRMARLAVKDVTAPTPRPAYGWETEIRRRQETIQQAYLDNASLLDASGDPTDKRLARDIKRFVANLPVAATRRQALATELRAVTEQRHTEEQAAKVELSAPIPEQTQTRPIRRR